MMELFSSHHRIGIIGHFYFGKTVLTTSIINNIKNHSKKYMPIKSNEAGGNSTNDIEIYFTNELPPDAGFERFPYADIRKKIHTQWPDLTEKIRQYKCSFFRSDWPMTKGYLSLVDIPGHRMSDLPMANKTFAEWSDWINDRFAEEADPKACGDWHRYLDDLKQSLSELNNAKKIVESYKNLLKNLFTNKRPLVTPSTFLINSDGEILFENIKTNDLTKCLTGIKTEKEFAPLPKSFRESNKALTKEYEKNYNLYRSEIVKPILISLLNCNSIVFLVDIVTILSQGPGWYNLSKEMVKDTLEILKPGYSIPEYIFGSLGSNIINMLGFGSTGIKKVAFIVPKADVIRMEDHELAINLLINFTKTLTPLIERNRICIKFHHDVISAAYSVEQVGNDKIRAKYGKDSTKEVEITLPKLPEEWEDDWPKEKYKFPTVIAPIIPKLIDSPPKSYNLNKLIAFLLKPSY